MGRPSYKHQKAVNAIMTKDKITVQEARAGSEKLGEEASLLDSDAIQRQVLRGDETKGDPDERDVAGAPPSEVTPQGREESKGSTSEAGGRNGG